MASAYDIPISVFIEKLKEELKTIKEIHPPEWALYVKTGSNKDRPPEQEDWWYYRTASILNQLYRRGVIGVNRLRNIYGGRKDRGHRPEKKAKAYAKIIRTILQQLEKAGLVEKHMVSHPKLQSICMGRRLTKFGRSLMDKVATRIAREMGILK